MRSRRVRLFTSIVLLGLFSGSMLSPHHHLNPIADLVSDGPSDSGRFLRSLDGPHPGNGEWFAPSDVVDDYPCPACFWHDALTLEASCIEFAAVLSVLPFRAPWADKIPGSLPPPRTIDRGPPVTR